MLVVVLVVVVGRVDDVVGGLVVEVLVEV